MIYILLQTNKRLKNEYKKKQIAVNAGIDTSEERKQTEVNAGIDTSEEKKPVLLRALKRFFNYLRK